MRFLKRTPRTPRTKSRASLFNEYALGSRVQYHVSAGGPRSSSSRSCASNAYQGRNVDDEVTIGWDSRRQHPGDRLMARRSDVRPDAATVRSRGIALAWPGPGSAAGRAEPMPALGLLLLFGFVAPLLIVLGYSFMPERTFDFTAAPISPGELPSTSSPRATTAPSSGRSGWPSLTVLPAASLIGYPLAYGLAKLFGPLGGAP